MAETKVNISSKKDILILVFVVLCITFFGTTIAFLILWQIEKQDETSWKKLYNECKGIDSAGIDDE